MTKKHFEAIAKQLNDSRQWMKTPEALEGLEFAAIALSRTFLDENPRFDRSRFLRACGLDVS